MTFRSSAGHVLATALRGLLLGIPVTLVGSLIYTLIVVPRDIWLEGFCWAAFFLLLPGAFLGGMIGMVVGIVKVSMAAAKQKAILAARAKPLDTEGIWPPPPHSPEASP